MSKSFSTYHKTHPENKPYAFPQKYYNNNF